MQAPLKYKRIVCKGRAIDLVCSMLERERERERKREKEREIEREREWEQAAPQWLTFRTVFCKATQCMFEI